MDPLPYRFLCARCAVAIESPAYDTPMVAGGCGPGGEHEWHRQVDPRRVAIHEAAHAIAAAVLLGAGSVQAVRMERPTQSDTVFLGRPDSPQALLIALSGPAASSRVGDARDGTDGDLRQFRRHAFTWLTRTLGSGPETMDDGARAIALSRSVAIMRNAFWSAACDFVGRWEASIDHLASEILERRRLEGPDLTRAVSEAMTAHPSDGFVSPVLDPGFPLEVWRLAVA